MTAAADLDELIAQLARAGEADRLATELERRGGGLTATAAAIAREQAARGRENAGRTLDHHTGGTA